MMERADARRVKSKRVITREGKPFLGAEKDPVDIARALRREKPADTREAKLREAERKLGIR